MGLPWLSAGSAWGAERILAAMDRPGACVMVLLRKERRRGSPGVEDSGLARLEGEVLVLMSILRPVFEILGAVRGEKGVLHRSFLNFEGDLFFFIIVIGDLDLVFLK